MARWTASPTPWRCSTARWASPTTPRWRKWPSEGIGLVVKYLPSVPSGTRRIIEARTALGLATDLGGYAIMLGGTNGAHLTSFSLVDILSHGRACAIMNPYYTVFFAPAVEEPLHAGGQDLPRRRSHRGRYRRPAGPRPGRGRGRRR